MTNVNFTKGLLCSLMIVLSSMVNGQGPVVCNVEHTQPHCSRPDGQIVVHAISSSGLEYSIDDGTTYQADSVFSGLFAGNYVIRIRDGYGWSL